MARKTRKQKGRGQSVSRAIGIYDEELRTAITRGEISEVRKLIPYVDINKKDNTGKTALHLACRLPIYSRSSYDIVKLFHEFLLDIQLTFFTIIILKYIKSI